MTHSNIPPIRLDGLGVLMQDLRIGEPVRFGRDLRVYPILGPEPSDSPDYDLLEDAQTAGRVDVDECREGPSVRTLRVRVRGARPVFVPEGTVLRGGLQTRTVNISLLLPEGEHPIPVSCVEAGRWGRYRAFRVEPLWSDVSLRHRKVRSVLRSLKWLREAHSDQADVWDHVDFALTSISAHSPTASYEAVLDVRAQGSRADAEAVARRLQGPVFGVLVTGRDRGLGLDLFGHPAVWQKLGWRVLESYAAAASWFEATSPLTVEAFLKGLAEAVRTVVPAPVGLGDHLLLGGPVDGFALVTGDRLVHLFVTPGSRNR